MQSCCKADDKEEENRDIIRTVINHVYRLKFKINLETLDLMSLFVVVLVIRTTDLMMKN